MNEIQHAIEEMQELANIIGDCLPRLIERIKEAKKASGVGGDDRYPVCDDQDAQIDCRRGDCEYNDGAGSCANISPAITLNPGKSYVCWTANDCPHYPDDLEPCIDKTALESENDELRRRNGKLRAEVAELKRLLEAADANASATIAERSRRCRNRARQTGRLRRCKLACETCLADDPGHGICSDVEKSL